MSADLLWQANADRLIVLFEAAADTICAATSAQLAATFPRLCLDPARPDAAAFQQMMYTQSPRRLHGLVLTTLKVRSLSVLSREYQWLSALVPRYGVTKMHLLAMAGWYFNAARRPWLPDTPEYGMIMSLKQATLSSIRTHVREQPV